MAVTLSAASAASAGGGPATDAYDGISTGVLDAHGLVDLYLAWNANQPPTGSSALRAFDTADGPSVGLIRLTLAHRPRRLGFRLDVGAGDLTAGYFANDPLAATRPELARWLSRVEQGFVTVVIPVGSGLEVDAGKLATPAGIEDNESLTNWSYSRSLIFTWAEPSYHTGVRLTYSFGDRLAASALWLNGWNSNPIGGNGLRSFALAVRARPHRRLELVLVYLGGLERAPTRLADPTLSFRSLIDGYLTVTVSPRWTLALTAAWAHDRAQGGVQFGGVAAYATVAACSWLSATVRGEVLADPSGFATGVRQTVGEVTGTLEAHATVRRLRLALRLEVRHDQSSARALDAAPAPRFFQDTVTIALLAAR